MELNVEAINPATGARIYSDTPMEMYLIDPKNKYIVAGDPLKFEESGGLVKCVKAATDDCKIAGVFPFTSKRAVLEPNSRPIRTAIYTDGAKFCMIAGESIKAGDCLKFEVTDNNKTKVKKQSDKTKVVAKALTSAASNQMLVVQLTLCCCTT